MLSIIVARSKNNVIGKNGRLPWNIPGELEQFKQLTTGNVVILGRKTYEEIGRPLPDRTNIIVSRTAVFSGENLFSARSLREAIDMADGSDIFVCGGYSLYEQAIPIVDKMYITEVDVQVENGDVYFPAFDKDQFSCVVGSPQGDGIKYTRTVYSRKR